MAEEQKKKRGRPPLKANKKIPLNEEVRPGFEEEAAKDAAKRGSGGRYYSIIIQRQEGESPTVGPIWNGSGTQLWLYRGARVVVPEWVMGVLEGTRVTTIECDMSTPGVDPEYYEVVKSRFEWDVLEDDLTEADYIKFRESLKTKKHDPWKKTRIARV